MVSLVLAYCVLLGGAWLCSLWTIEMALHMLGIGHWIFLSSIEASVVMNCTWRINCGIMAATLKFIVTARPFLDPWVGGIRICLSRVGVTNAVHATRVLVSWPSTICLSIEQESLVGLHGLLLHIIQKPLPGLTLAWHHQLRGVVTLTYRHWWLLVLCSLCRHVLWCLRGTLPSAFDAKLLSSCCAWLLWVIERLVFLENLIFWNKSSIGARSSNIHGWNVRNVISDEASRFTGRTGFSLFLLERLSNFTLLVRIRNVCVVFFAVVYSIVH